MKHQVNQNKMEKDIFDKLMHLPVLRIFEPFYLKYKEALLYLFFGGLTFCVSIGTFALFSIPMGINELLANVLSWIIAVLFAFFTNRIWVFAAPTKTTGEFIKQMASFFAGRFATLVVEEAIILIFITWLGFNAIIVKVVAQIIVILLNYVISKLLIFRKS